MRRDGTVCATPGYDPASKVLYYPNDAFLPVADEPTPAEAARALDKLREPFLEFPFADGASESAFLAHILTEAARPALETSPLFWYSAPTAGTGKSLLADMPSLITHGLLPARSAWVSDTDEMRKNLYAALCAGDRSITFDNVPTGHTVRSGILCGFLTSEIHRDRTLGESNAKSIPNRAVVTCSGNNVTPGGDLARRAVVIMLDANMTGDQLRKRTFKIRHLPSYVRARRVELLHAALTILRAAIVHGKTKETPMPSFERWSDIVREALLFLGLPDPLANQDSETEDDGTGADVVFEGLAKLLGPDHPFTSRQLVTALTSMNAMDENLIQTLTSAGCEAPTDPIKVGYWLKKHRNKIYGGYKLVQRMDANDRRVRRYTLQPTRQQSMSDLV
jgi:putative DNA primase/helicase